MRQGRRRNGDANQRRRAGGRQGAEQRFAGGLESGPEKLSQVQFEQTEKLKEVAAHLQLQLDVFQQMKAAMTNSVKSNRLPC